MFNRTSALKWKCSGTLDNPHPQVRNGGDKCRLCGRTSPDELPVSNNKLSKPAIAGIATGIVVFLSIASYGLYHKFQSCPPNYQKRDKGCVYAPNIFDKPDVSGEIFQ